MLLLKKVFFEKLLNLFQSNHPDLSLKLVKILIGILGNVVHNFFLFNIILIFKILFYKLKSK